MPVPEGYKGEIVGGNIFMASQRDTHCPGHLNGFASDVTLMAEDAATDDKGLWRYEDVEFVAEVISRKTGANDYGPKKDACTASTGASRAWASKDEIDLTGTVVGLVLNTDEFPRGRRPRYAAGASSSRWSRGTNRTRGCPRCQPTARRRLPTRARTRPIAAAAATATAPPAARPTRAP